MDSAPSKIPSIRAKLSLLSLRGTTTLVFYTGKYLLGSVDTYIIESVKFPTDLPDSAV